MTPFEPAGGLAEGQWALAESGRHYLACSLGGPSIRLDLSAAPASATFAVYWIDAASGNASAGGAVPGGAVRDFKSPGRGRAVLWLARKEGPR
jgi:hypothetical protein